MTTAILALTDPRSAATSARCAALAGYVARLRELDGDPAELATGPADVPAALTALAAAAVVTGEDGTDQVVYAPSPAARETVGTGRDGSWPDTVVSRQRRVVRRTVGALWRLPLEEPVDGGEQLEVFITEWSASPAACAVAVLPTHPLSPGLPAGQDAVFTGRFCRHPLTGDLLPVWAAAWVKAEFGSGAVLVNPAHDQVDLAFARQVGLPVRFALQPPGSDGTPKTWPTPPVIRAGTAVRTGTATDGLVFSDARAAYLATLTEWGLATEHVDYGLGAFPVAARSAGAGAEVGWDAGRRTVTAGGTPTGVTGLPVLAAADPAIRSADLLVVVPSTAAETDLLALRLLLAEPGLTPAVRTVPELLLVGAVSGSTDGVPADTLRLTTIVTGAPHETASVKAQQVEASQRFLDAHAELAGREAAAGELSAEVAKAAGQIKGMLARRDTKQGFTQLYRLQKSLVKAPALTTADRSAYGALAYVLAGLEPGSGDRPAAAAWRDL